MQVSSLEIPEWDEIKEQIINDGRSSARNLIFGHYVYALVIKAIMRKLKERKMEK